jgi:hypothetical protein
VTGALAGFVSSTRTTAGRQVAYLVMKTVAPAFSGSARVGQTLTASVKVWAAGATISYQWVMDGKPLKGANSKSIRLTSGHRGHKLSLLITQNLKGYTPATATSASVKVG